MGLAELNEDATELTVHSHIITYGTGASPALTEQLRTEIEDMWNEPRATLVFNGRTVAVRFRITANCTPGIDPLEVYQNLDARNNYFRIEEFAHGNISFVDGLGCNSGYFKVENLYQGSTTAAHEYGHTLGLDHPRDLDLRGKGVPGIMYPRGTLVDPPFQYDPAIPAGQTGGTMHPMYRKVKVEDVVALKLPALLSSSRQAIVGGFTNYYHPNQADV